MVGHLAARAKRSLSRTFHRLFQRSYSSHEVQKNSTDMHIYSTAHEQLNTLVRESRESLASSVVGSRETNWLHSREHWATLARTLGYTRENTGLHSQEHWATLARTLGYTRENTGLHSREHWATLARTLGYTREATWLHSRGHLATLARTISYTRELHTRGHLATITLARPLGYSNTREATWLARLHSRGHCIDEADIIMGATRRGAALL